MLKPSTPFVKMQAQGNDFVVIDEWMGATGFDRQPQTIRRICDRHFGVGADQLLILEKDRGTRQISVLIFNQDGSEAEMCGNGLRSVAAYVKKRASQFKVAGDKVELKTCSGTHEATIVGEEVRISIGVPHLGAKEVLTLRDHAKIEYFRVNMGNPHAVILNPQGASPFSPRDLERIGSEIERHPAFERGTNVEWVTPIEGESAIHVQVWERGAGATLACGSGACASGVVALTHLFRGKSKVKVLMPGGELGVEFDSTQANAPVFLSGTTTEVFSGVF